MNIIFGTKIKLDNYFLTLSFLLCLTTMLVSFTTLVMVHCSNLNATLNAMGYDKGYYVSHVGVNRMLRTFLTRSS